MRKRVSVEAVVTTDGGREVSRTTIRVGDIVALEVKSAQFDDDDPVGKVLALHGDSVTLAPDWTYRWGEPGNGKIRVISWSACTGVQVLGHDFGGKVTPPPKPKGKKRGPKPRDIPRSFDQLDLSHPVRRFLAKAYPEPGLLDAPCNACGAGISVGCTIQTKVRNPIGTVHTSRLMKRRAETIKRDRLINQLHLIWTRLDMQPGIGTRGRDFTLPELERLGLAANDNGAWRALPLNPSTTITGGTE